MSPLALPLWRRVLTLSPLAQSPLLPLETSDALPPVKSMCVTTFLCPLSLYHLTEIAPAPPLTKRVPSPPSAKSAHLLLLFRKGKGHLAPARLL